MEKREREKRERLILAWFCVCYMVVLEMNEKQHGRERGRVIKNVCVCERERERERERDREL